MKNPFLPLAARTAAATALLSSRLALAHDGHGLADIHWHASDTWGFLCLAALAGVALWSSRDK